MDPTLPWLPPEGRDSRFDASPVLLALLRSDLVAVSRGLRVQSSRVHTRHEGTTLEEGAYRSIVGEVDECLLGPCPEELAWELYCTSSEEAHPSCETVRRAVGHPGEPVLLMLTHANGEHLYLADRFDGGAFLPADDVAAVRTTLESVRSAPDRFRRLERGPFDRAVSNELQRMTRSPREQYDALRALLKLGDGAVPAIVRNLQDKRSLPRPYILVENAPGFFETHAQYGPRTVMDVLTIVLGRFTGTSLCTNLRNATEDRPGQDVRKRCARRWQAFVVLATDSASVDARGDAQGGRRDGT